MLRIWVVLAVLWIGGMGWYQYQEVDKSEKNSFTIAISKDAQFHIDTNGISNNNDRKSMQMQRIGLVFLPPLLLLALFPIGAWLARGFKSESNK